ncbi:MAG: hypothetical protein IJR46_04070 [Neisseriaceae bacterium]|nr:hypothetical protein [Neisseriaceae bacterium]
MSDYHKTVINDTLSDIQSLMRDTFQDFLIEVETLEKENKYLKNRIKELEELLKIAKERD